MCKIVMMSVRSTLIKLFVFPLTHDSHTKKTTSMDCNYRATLASILCCNNISVTRDWLVGLGHEHSGWVLARLATTWNGICSNRMMHSHCLIIYILQYPCLYLKAITRTLYHRSNTNHRLYTMNPYSDNRYRYHSSATCIIM